jgi:hypothetical protein
MFFGMFDFFRFSARCRQITLACNGDCCCCENCPFSFFCVFIGNCDTSDTTVIQCTYYYFALKIRFHWNVEGCRAWESVAFLMIFLLKNRACRTTMELGVKVQAIFTGLLTRLVWFQLPIAPYFTDAHPVAVALQSSILRLIAVVTLARCSSVQGKWLPLPPSHLIKHWCLTHVWSFDVADFVLSSQLGVICKLQSHKFEVHQNKTKVL